MTVLNMYWKNTISNKTKNRIKHNNNSLQKSPLQVATTKQNSTYL